MTQPERIGPYVIEKKVGAGGMGTVYHAHHAETGDEAAVKVLPASLAREEGFIARFFREIEAMKKLVNPHVVELYDSGVDDETYYYAMEYVDGETLTGKLRREKRIGWQETIEIAAQICTALKAAHDAGIVHRDLKPSNLLIAGDGTVKLTDFGVAQVFAGTRLTVTGGIIGTAEYMSPEQATGKRATKKSDLYSLGAVMYVMLTGRPPFRGKTTLDVIQKQRYGQFDRPCRIVPEIPHWLDEIVVQLLEKEPDKRYADAYVLMRRLQEIIKKVELSKQSATRVAGDLDGTAPTVAIGMDAEDPGGGTLMRDLLRAEIEQSHKPSPLGELFNNIWFLVLMLLIVIGGGILWFQSGETTDAKDSQQIESGAQTRNLRVRGPASEAETFLQLAQHYVDVGEIEKAEQKLSALMALLDGVTTHDKLRRKTERLLHSIQQHQENKERSHVLLESSMQRAEDLSNAGKVDEARNIWTGVIELYGSDPQARWEVEKAKTLLGNAGG